MVSCNLLRHSVQIWWCRFQQGRLQSVRLHRSLPASALMWNASSVPCSCRACTHTHAQHQKACVLPQSDPGTVRCTFAVFKLFASQCTATCHCSNSIRLVQARTALTPEESCFTIFAQVGLHTLKTTDSIVQSLGSRMHRDVSKGFDNRLTPALSIYVLNHEHMVSERGTKDKVLHCKHIVVCRRNRMDGELHNATRPVSPDELWAAQCAV